MKKSRATIRSACVVCFLSFFAVDQSAASNVTSNGKATQPHSGNIKLEELLQNLEDAHPWTIEKVSQVLGTKLTPGRSNGTTTNYMANQLSYGEGLLIAEAALRVFEKNNKPVYLFLDINKDTACFKHDYIKKIYTGLRFRHPGPIRHTLEGKPAPYTDSTFQVERPWGTLYFRFNLESPTFSLGTPDCLIGITFELPRPKDPIPLINRTFPERHEKIKSDH